MKHKRFESLWKSRFIGSFASLLAFIFVAPIILSFYDNLIVLEVMYIFIIGTSLYAIKQNKQQMYLGFAFAVIGIMFKSFNYVEGQENLALIGYASMFFFYLIFIKAILADLLTLEKTTTDSLCAAVVGYLMVGAAFAELYRIVNQVSPSAFSGLDGPGGLSYFSIVTLTTLGYGDILPSSQVTKSLVILEAVTGVFYMAVLVSHLVSGISQNRRK